MFVVGLLAGFTLYGPKSGAYSAAETAAFVGQSSTGLIVSIYLFAVSSIGLILLGKDEVLGFFAQLAERAGGTFRVDVHDVLANDEHVVALVKGTAEREGKTLNDNGAQVFHVRGGKVTEEWFHPGDEYASDEFWG